MTILILIAALVLLVANWNRNGRGYVNRGPDPRILGAWAGHLQAALSFKTLAADGTDQRWRPVRLIVTFGAPIPLPCLLIAVPKWREARWYTLRIGWRFDGWGYVADVAAKTLDWDL